MNQAVDQRPSGERESTEASRPNVRLKVLYVITKSNWGGAQRYVFDLATNLPKEEFEVVVALGGTGQKNAQEGLLATKLREKGIRVILVKNFLRDISFFKEFVSFFNLFYLFAWKVNPDIVHLNSSKAAALGVVVARITFRKKIIFTVHGWPFKENRGFLARKLLYFISWFTAFLSDIVIVVSKADKEMGERMRLVRKKIVHIPIAERPVEILPRETAEQVLFRRDVEIDRPFLNSIRLVTIAELTPNKGLRYTIEMMKELDQRSPRKYSYLIFGTGEEGSSLSQYAEASGVGPLVRFGSIISNMPRELESEASKYLAAFDIFILPSIKEGMPYVLLEAAAAGLPIIATDIVKAEVPNIPNINFVPPENGLALANAVEKLVQNMPTKSPNMVGSFDTMLKETTALYYTKPHR